MNEWETCIAEWATRCHEKDATIAALQAVIRQMGEQAAVLAKDGMAAKAQVAALQRERKQAEQKHLQDVAYMRSQYDSIVAMKDEVQTALTPAGGGRNA